MHEFERLIGEWEGEGELPTDPPMRIRTWATVEHLGNVPGLPLVRRARRGPRQPLDHRRRTRGRAAADALLRRPRRPARVPDDPRRLDWTIWLAPGYDWNGPHGPGFNQRFIGELSADGDTIDGRWERGLGAAGDEWELDFPLTYRRS